MAQVVLQVFQMFCGIPGGSIGGALVAPLNPPLLISSFLPIMMSVMYIGSPNMLNSSDSNTKEWARGSQNAFIIYYLIFFFIALSILTTACKVADLSPI
jgi:hypothetical protein